MCLIWDVAPGERSTEEWAWLARLLACARIDETGAVVALGDHEFYTAWLQLRGETHRPAGRCSIFPLAGRGPNCLGVSPQLRGKLLQSRQAPCRLPLDGKASEGETWFC